MTEPSGTGRPSRPERPARPGRPGRRAAAPPRDAGSWAPNVHRLSTGPDRAGTNLAGRRLTGPIQGFGQMWQKTYRLDLGPDIPPRHAIGTWKAHFGEFWPAGSRFDDTLTGISPGDVALLDVGLGGGVRLSTGVFVLYADEDSYITN